MNLWVVLEQVWIEQDKMYLATLKRGAKIIKRYYPYPLEIHTLVSI